MIVMKKIMLIFAAMAVVFASCSKSEFESESVNGSKEYVLDINVAAPGADADTKALIKTDWAPGDNIKVWFDEDTENYIVIKYSGSKWELDSGEIPENLKKVDGKIKALYKGGVIVAATEDYTVTNEGDKNVVRFYIDSWKFLTEIQVVVTGIPNTLGGVYFLKCDQFKALKGDKYIVGESDITADLQSEYNTDVLGTDDNQDGHAFVFGTANYSSEEQTYKFTLKDVINDKEYTYSVKKSGFTKNSSTIKALKIAYSKFTAAVPEYVVMKMGTGNSAYTLKWATMNLGATTVAGSYTTCYGDLYQWGSVNTLYDGFPYGSATGWEFKGTWKPGKTNGFETNNREYKGDDTTLPDDNDVVKQTIGGGWRMPTSQEFKDLADACGGSSNYNTSKKPGKDTNVDKGIYWCTNYDGVAGCLFCDGVNKLFFPAAGYGINKQLSSAGTTGGYWSSSLCSNPTSNAHNLYFNSTYVSPESGQSRFEGFSIRRVSN